MWKHEFPLLRVQGARARSDHEKSATFAIMAGAGVENAALYIRCDY
jgi:hypothetical protein